MGFTGRLSDVVRKGGVMILETVIKVLFSISVGVCILIGLFAIAVLVSMGNYFLALFWCIPVTLCSVGLYLFNKEG